MSRPLGWIFGSLLMLLVAATASTRVQADQTVVVILDDSGSMDRTMETSRQRRIAAAKLALASVLRSLSHDTKVGILALNSTVNGSHWVVPVGSLDPSRWSASLGEIRAKGGTPLGAFMRQGADELLQLRAKQPYETFRLLVVTDGEASDAPLLAGILPDLLSRGLTVDVIGVDMQADHSLARSAHSYRRAGDQTALADALSQVFAETTSDDQTNASEFDMLSGLPDDAAAEIVKGLSAPRNDPLQLITLDPNQAVQPVATSVPGSNNALPIQGTKSFSFAFASLCCLSCVGLAMLIVVAIVLGAVKNKTRS